MLALDFCWRLLSCSFSETCGFAHPDLDFDDHGAFRVSPWATARADGSDITPVDDERSGVSLTHGAFQTLS